MSNRSERAERREPEGEELSRIRELYEAGLYLRAWKRMSSLGNPSSWRSVEARIVESMPIHDHDQRVDWLATEHGVRECKPRR